MKLSTRQLTYDALTLTLLIVGGVVLYYLSKILPVPGAKFLLMAPYLTIVLYYPVKRSPKPGTISLINLGFAALLSLVSLFMGIAIVLSGVLTDLTVLLLFRGYDTEWKRRLGISFYPAYAMLTSLFITDFITGRHLYGNFGLWPIIFMTIATFVLGYIGAVFGSIIEKRVSKGVKRLRNESEY